MPNETKIGLVLGLLLVIAVAVMFFESEPRPTQPAAAVETAPSDTPPSAASLQPPSAVLPKPDRSGAQLVGQTTSRSTP